MIFSNSKKEKKEKKMEIAPAPAPERGIPPAPAPSKPAETPDMKDAGTAPMEKTGSDGAVEKMKEKFALKPPEKKHPQIKVKPPKKKALPKPKVIVKEIIKVKKIHDRLPAKAKPVDEGPDRKLLGKEMDMVFDEALKNKEKIQELEHLRKDLEIVKNKVEGPAFKNLEDIIYSEFDKMNKIVEENKEKELEFADSMKAQVDTIKKDIEQMKKVEEKMKSLDVEGFRRDLESVKQKVRWVQDHIEAFDILPLVELLKDVEARVNDLKVSSPVIID